MAPFLQASKHALKSDQCENSARSRVVLRYSQTHLDCCGAFDGGEIPPSRQPRHAMLRSGPGGNVAVAYSEVCGPRNGHARHVPPSPQQRSWSNRAHCERLVAKGSWSNRANGQTGLTVDTNLGQPKRHVIVTSARHVTTARANVCCT